MPTPKVVINGALQFFDLIFFIPSEGGVKQFCEKVSHDVFWQNIKGRPLLISEGQQSASVDNNLFDVDLLASFAVVSSNSAKTCHFNHLPHLSKSYRSNLFYQTFFAHVHRFDAKLLTLLRFPFVSIIVIVF
jgi:hypothetical protein